MTQFEGVYNIAELTECPECGTMYEEKRLGIGECGTCYVTKVVKEMHKQMQYMRWGTLPLVKETE